MEGQEQKGAQRRDAPRGSGALGGTQREGETMKSSELTKCRVCESPLGSISFRRVTIEHCIVNTGAVRREAGLAMMMGSDVLAWAIGPDEDVAVVVGTVTGIVCDRCYCRASLGEIAEQIGKTEETLAR